MVSQCCIEFTPIAPKRFGHINDEYFFHFVPLFDNYELRLYLKRVFLKSD